MTSHSSVLSRIAIVATALAFVATPVVAFADAPTCVTGIGSPLVVDVTQQITNDPDSSNFNGGTWALDNFTRHIQVWAEGAGYCAQADDNGTFTTAGGLSPQNGYSIPAGITGTFSGGTSGEITGAMLGDAASWGFTGAAPAQDGQTGLTTLWVQNYFAGGSYDYSSNTSWPYSGWGWTYTTTNNGTWFNGNSGNTGDLYPVYDTTTHAGYATIQAAVTGATAGDTISIAPGTYSESVLITKPLTLSGGTGTKPVIKGLAPANYVVKVDGVSGPVTLTNLEVNGGGTTRGDNAFDYGVFINNSGTSGTPVTLQNSTVKNVWNVSANGVGVETNSYALIHDDTISSFDKRGVRFIDSTGKIYNDEVIGDNVDGTSRVQNLLNLWGGSTVEIYGNKLHNALTTGTTPTWDSPAIFVSSYGGSGASVANIHDNEIYASDTGLTLGSLYATTDTSSATVTNNYFHDLNQAINFEKSTISATITNNKFENSNTGVTADDGSGTLTPPSSIGAAQNWWGAASGPFATTTNPTGTGASVYDGVTFSPWYTNALKTTLSFTVATSSATTTTTTTGATTLNSTTTAAVAVTATIPSGTTITGDASWNGIINPPTATTTTVTVVGSDTSVTSAIAIGSSLTDLTFDKAVQLVFAGQAGKRTGWYDHAGVFTEITTTCADNTQTTNDGISAGSSCKIDSGADLIVWTKHFSTFVTYIQNVSGGGAGGGPAAILTTTSSGGSSIAPVATTTAPVASTTPAVVTGEVLGAEAYNFSKTLSFGSRGTDVTELHKILIAGGYLKISAPTGYFGSLTKAAVMAYQKANKVPATGVVATLTRAQLNKGVLPTKIETTTTATTTASH